MTIDPAPIDYELNRPQYDRLRAELEKAGFVVRVEPDRRRRRRHAVALHLASVGNAYAAAAEVAKHVKRHLQGLREGAPEREQVPIYDRRGLLLQMVRVGVVDRQV